MNLLGLTAVCLQACLHIVKNQPHESEATVENENLPMAGLLKHGGSGELSRRSSREGWFLGFILLLLALQ